MKFTDALKLFEEHLQIIGRSPETIRTYDGHLTRIYNYMCQKYNRTVDIEEINTDDFERYLYGFNFKPMSRHGISTAFKSFYSFCYKKGYCKINIGKEIITKKARSKERTFISEEEMLKICDGLSQEVYKFIIKTLYYAGLRISEAINLTIEDVNMDENYILVRKHKSRFDRKVPISIKLQNLFEYYLEYERHDAESDKFFVIEKPDSFKQYINILIKQAAENAGLKLNISHTMRHSFASNLIAKDVSIVVIQKLLGHVKIRSTAIYLHSNMQSLKSAVNTL